MRFLSIAGFAAVFSATALADVSLSNMSLDSTAPGMAVLSANVTGTGDVFAEYAHDKSKSFRSVKDRYVTDGVRRVTFNLEPYEFRSFTAPSGRPVLHNGSLSQKLLTREIPLKPIR